MKVAVCADIHAHNYKEFDRHSDLSGSERLDYIIHALTDIKDICVSRNIRTLLIAGDLFHIRSRVPTVVMNSVYDTIKNISEYFDDIIMIPGNHDDNDNSDLPKHSLHTFKDIPNVYVSDKLNGCLLLSDGTAIACARYSKNTEMVKEYIRKQAEMSMNNPGMDMILMAHVGVNGGLIGKGNYPMAEAFDVEDLYPEAFSSVVLGHFHKRQFLGGYNHVFYCGAPIQHSYSDEGEDKGFYIIDTEIRHGRPEFVPLDYPMFVTLSSDDALNEYLVNHNYMKGNYLRFQIKESELDELKTILAKMPGLQYKIELEKEYKEESRIDIKVGMSPEEVIKKYAEEYAPDQDLNVESTSKLGLDILETVKRGL
jgi:DNA repair exonuclease SbcCD nuclease subunit